MLTSHDTSILSNGTNILSIGDKIRIQPNGALFISPQAYRDIYDSKGNVKRAKSYEAWAKNVNEPNTALATDPAVHARKRKILNMAFTERTVKHAAAFMTQHADRWVELLVSDMGEDTWGKKRNMTEWNSYVVFDILGDLCFGRSFEIKEPGPNPIRAIPKMIEKHVRFFYPVSAPQTSPSYYSSVELIIFQDSPLPIPRTLRCPQTIRPLIPPRSHHAPRNPNILQFRRLQRRPPDPRRRILHTQTRR